MPPKTKAPIKGDNSVPKPEDPVIPQTIENPQKPEEAPEAPVNYTIGGSVRKDN